MAHGSKKWVIAVDTPRGRVKRSRHRTVHDKLGRLAIGEIVHRNERNRNSGDDAARRRAGYDYSAWLRHAPKWFRRQLNQEYRARTRQLMLSGRYDALSNRRPRDAAWKYW